MPFMSFLQGGYQFMVVKAKPHVEVTGDPAVDIPAAAAAAHAPPTYALISLKDGVRTSRLFVNKNECCQGWRKPPFNLSQKICKIRSDGGTRFQCNLDTMGPEALVKVQQPTGVSPYELR